MKLLLGLLVSLAISSAFATPVRSPKDEVDIVDVSRGQQRSRESNSAGANDDGSDVDPDFRNFKGVVDTGAGYPFLAPLPQPFSFNLGFFDSFEDIFRRLRTRLWSVGSEETSEEGGFSIGSRPPKGGNTTSVVKVVDGHKIEINDTVYGNGDGKNGAVFKFRVINIRPLDSGEDVADSATDGTTIQSQTRDIEGKSDEKKEDSSEESKPDDNEISANIDDPESTTKAAISTEMQDIDQVSSSLDSNAVNLDEVEEDLNESLAGAEETLDEDADTPDEDNASNTIKSERLSMSADADNYNPGDDSEDGELQNAEIPLSEAMKKLSTEQEMLNRNRGGHYPQRENFTSSDDEDENEDANDVDYEGVNSEWGSLNDKNSITNEIDEYESVPVDLSNDIAVNAMMADQGAPVNPDAEVFDVDEFLETVGNHGGPPPRFEVLRDMK